MSETCTSLRRLLDSDSYAWRQLCERSDYERFPGSKFSWKVTYRAERFIDLNFGRIQAAIALNGAAGFGLTEIADYILTSREVTVDSQTDFFSAGYTQVGSCALHTAAKHDRMGTLNFLLEKGASPDLADSNGRTALMIAASHGHLEICSRLVRGGASLTVSTHFGFTALHFAALTHSCELVNFFLSAGAPVDARDQRGWTPLVVALSPAAEPIRLRRTLAALLLAGADPRGIEARAAGLGLEEISRWLRDFINHLSN